MRKIKVKISATILFVVSLTGLYAQSAIPVAGGNAASMTGSVSYTVGQMFYSTNTGTNGSVSEGVQQPFEISVVSALEVAKDITLQYLVYPNPAKNNIVLKVENNKGNSFSDLSISLYDIKGTLLLSRNIVSDETGIVLSNYADATYFLKVYENSKEVKIFKIIKN